MQFNYAPAEVVWEIARNLPCRDQKSLRLTCSQFNLATESLVLRYLVINVSAKASAATISQLQILAEEKTRVSEWARSLKIESLKPPSPYEEAPKWLKYFLDLCGYDVDDCMKKYLVKAISTLKRVESVVWIWNRADPLWTTGPVMDAIASLPLMNNFQLAMDDEDAAISLDRLSGLRKFVVRGRVAASVLGSLAEVIGNNPDLSHLFISVPDSLRFSPYILGRLAEVIGNSPNLSHLVIGVPNSLTLCMPFSKTSSTTSLPLRYLAVRASHLDLNPIRHTIDFNSFNLEYTGLDSDVYVDLARARLFCSRLIVYYVDSILLDYLSQCSGSLQEVSLLLREDSSALAGRFWGSVLPEHAATLQVLNVCSRVGGGWCFSDQAIRAIMQCSRLRSLTLTVDPHSTGRVRLFALHDNFEHDYDQSAFDKIVSSIMDLSLGLPNLIHIHILISHSNFFSSHYSYSVVVFLNYFVDELVSNLTKYRGQATGLVCLAELIQVESRMCRPRQWLDGTWQYNVVVPRYGLKPLRVRWDDHLRSRVGCDFCLGQF